MTLPTPNMSEWTMLDFEVALEGIRQINAASLCIQNQPRSYNSATRAYHPGGEFIAAIGEDWCASILTLIVEAMEAHRFDDAEEEDRRLRLLLHYHTQWGPAGDSLPDIMVMLERWRAPIAA